MLERLDYVKLVPGRVLDAGAGPSPQKVQFARRYPKAQLIALDFSLSMLRASRPASFLERLTRPQKAHAVCADLARMPLAGRSISMVWSNMALHWAADVQGALGEFHRVLEVGGLLMFSTLGPDTLKELRSAFSGVPGGPRVHQFIDMHDIGDMLVSAGFEAPVMDTESITVTYQDVGAMTRDLRATGQTCALRARPRGLFAPRYWHKAREAIQGTLREGRLPMTAEVVYGHAWKPAPRVSAEGHAIVNLKRPLRFSD